jgi:DNA mismatch repair protein MutS
MKQYIGIKEQYPDAIVLFRLGDFYEMFGDDAKTASRVLQIALTTRDKNKDDPLPMCGIPHFAAENYISKLIKAGHKVAICEQVEVPKQAKGIVQRKVVRVITPGTHTPEHPKENNYILSLINRRGLHGIAVADVSTGEFLIYESSRPIEDEVSQFEPVEVIIPESLSTDIHYQETLQKYYLSTVEDWKYDYDDAYKSLLRHFRVNSLEGYGCEGQASAISAAGALISYLEETQKELLAFTKISTPRQNDFMFLDEPTRKNLELIRNLKDGDTEGSLLWALDETLTPMGGRFLRNALLRPLVRLDSITRRHLAVKYLVEDYELIERLRRGLRHMQDIGRLAQKLTTGSANARDLAAIKNSLEVLPAIQKPLALSVEDHLRELGESIPDFRTLHSLIDRAIEDHAPHSLRDGGIIKKGYNIEVDDLRDISVNAKDYIASIEAKERKATGINTLKVGYNRIHGYFIEVTKANIDLVPPHYERKQTLVNAERFITPELKEHESKVLGADERIKLLEYEVFMTVLEEAQGYADDLTRASDAMAEIDFLVSLAVVAKRHNYTMPKMTEDASITVVNGRHPVIEKLPLADRFVPNDTAIDGEAHRLLIITGPNMAGKSTYMRQVALIVLMAQTGSFVPADEAGIGVVDRIFTRIGASDYLTRGQSTFMVEMVETANILNNATDRSLILLDEVGRGTSTFDGISIAWATADYITQQIRARTLFATHYNELTDLSRRLDGIKNYNIAVKEWGEEIIFLRKIEPGPADKSYGIQVGRLAGLPQAVIEKAKDVLHLLERQHMGEGSKNFRQLDLFAAPQQDISEAIKKLDLDAFSPEDVVARLRELKKSL